MRYERAMARGGPDRLARNHHVRTIEQAVSKPDTFRPRGHHSVDACMYLHAQHPRQS